MIFFTLFTYNVVADNPAILLTDNKDSIWNITYNEGLYKSTYGIAYRVKSYEQNDIGYDKSWKLINHHESYNLYLCPNDKTTWYFNRYSTDYWSILDVNDIKGGEVSLIDENYSNVQANISGNSLTLSINNKSWKMIFNGTLWLSVSTNKPISTLIDNNNNEWILHSYGYYDNWWLDRNTKQSLIKYREDLCQIVASDITWTIIIYDNTIIITDTNKVWIRLYSLCSIFSGEEREYRTEFCSWEEAHYIRNWAYNKEANESVFTYNEKVAIRISIDVKYNTTITKYNITNNSTLWETYINNTSYELKNYENSNINSNLSIGAIVGIAIGCSMIAIIITIIVYYFICKQHNQIERKTIKFSESTNEEVKV